MAQQTLGALTSINTSLQFDAMFTELYALRNLATVSGSNIGLGMTPAVKLDVSGGGRFSGTALPIASASGLSGVSVGLSGGFPQLIWSYAAAPTDQKVWDCYSDSTTLTFRGLDDAGGVATNWLVVTRSGTSMSSIVFAAPVRPSTDNARTLGTSSFRWSTVYAGTGTINTSDAREKTSVSSMTPAEVAAARDLAREIGTYRFLAAVEEKGIAARQHVGMTVQRAIEVMKAHALDPVRYGFICHDSWSEEVIRHPAKMAPHPTLLSEDGQPVLVQVKAAYTEVIPAGDRYGFRPDELLLFIARGMEARLTALEAAA